MIEEERPETSVLTEKQPHAGHRRRMRVRFAESGFDNYQPHEMLEQLLFGSYTRGNTNTLAHELLRRFGTLEGVLNVSRDELMTVSGIGEKSAQVILSVRETVSRSIRRQLCGTRLIPENVPFLADWFLGSHPKGKVCWIECDEDRQMVNITAETLPEPDRESLLAFGERMQGKRGILLAPCGKKAGRWSGESFAFLDGVFGMSGGRLYGAFVLRGRKIVRFWQNESDRTEEISEDPGR